MVSRSREQTAPRYRRPIGAGDGVGVRTEAVAVGERCALRAER